MDEYYSEFYTFLALVQNTKTYELNQIAYQLSGRHELQKIFSPAIIQVIKKYPSLYKNFERVYQSLEVIIDRNCPMLAQINTINSCIDAKNQTIIDLSTITNFFKISHFNHKEIGFLKDQLVHYIGHRDIAAVCIIKTQLELLED